MSPRLAAAVGLVAGLPVLASIVAAILTGWAPLGDDAVIVARAYDVLSARPPLLGQFSASSGVLGQEVHSLGPLQYWLLVLPAWLGPAWTPALVTGLLNLAALVGCVVLAARRGGATLALLTGAVLALACVSLSAETWHSVWNPSVALLPLALLAFAAWSLADGETWALPLIVGLAAFVVQCHLAYVMPAAGLLAVALLRHRRTPRRTVLVAAAVALVAFSAPLAEAVIHRPSNLELVARSARAQGPKLGWEVGARAVARTVGVAPWWMQAPRTEVERLADVTEGPGILTAVTAALVLLGLLAAVAIGPRAPAALALVLVGAVGAVAAATPSSDGLFIAIGYTLRWASFAGAFAWLVLAWWGLRALPPPGRRGVALGVAGVAAVAVAVTLATRQPDRLEPLYRPVERAASAVDALAPPGAPIRVQGPAAYDANGFDAPVGLLTALRRRGRSVRSGEYHPQLGGAYRPEPGERLTTVTVGRPPGRGARVVARLPATDRPGTLEVAVAPAR